MLYGFEKLKLITIHIIRGVLLKKSTNCPPINKNLPIHNIPYRAFYQ